MAVSFRKQLNQEVKKFGRLASREVTAAAKGAWRVAVENTPPGRGTKRNTGALQYNWKLKNNTRGYYVPKRILRARPTMPKYSFAVTKHKRIILYNNMPYAVHVENGAGPGRRTPRLMMKKASIFLEQDLNRRMIKLKGVKL